MVPGLTEREIRAAELRRRELIVAAERERLGPRHPTPAASPRPTIRSPGYGWPRFGGARRLVPRCHVRPRSCPSPDAT